MSSTPFSDLIDAAKEAKYEVIPASWYGVVVRDCTATKSSTGKDMLKMSVKVAAGPHKGANLITQQTLSPENPAAIAIFLRSLAAFGVTEEWLAELPPREDGGPNMGAVAAALKGQAAMAEVDVHEWNGEDRNGIKKFRAAKPEEQQQIQDALTADGVQGDAFGAPKAPPADPFGGGSSSGAPANKPF